MWVDMETEFRVGSLGALVLSLVLFVILEVELELEKMLLLVLRVKFGYLGRDVGRFFS